MPDPILDDLAELFADTVTVESFTSADAFGAESYGSPVTYAARVVGQSRLVRGADGREQVSTVKATIVGTGFAVKDRVTLPVRFDPRTPPPIAIERIPDENGPHHEVIHF